MAPHYAWTPTGYVFIPGYWDYSIPRRGVIYSPIVVNSAVVPASYVYTPNYAVADVLVLDAMFVNPYYAHYYFGDYYGPAYANRGYVTTVVYSRTYYEPVVVYQRWYYRDNPRWFDLQVNVVLNRNAGRAPLPPRTLIEQQQIINNRTVVNNYFTSINYKGPVLAPAKTLMAAHGIPTKRLDAATRTHIVNASRAVQVAAATERRKTESAGMQARPRQASMAVPPVPVAKHVGPTGVMHAGPATTQTNHTANPAHGTASGTPHGTVPHGTVPHGAVPLQPAHPGTLTQPTKKGNPPRFSPVPKRGEEKRKKDR